MPLCFVPAPTLKTTSAKLHPDLVTLLKQYVKLFDNPKTLPPVRPHDLKTPLTNENHTFKIMPYRHPTS